VVPHMPMSTFDVRLPEVGIAQQPGTLRGYVTTASAGSVTMHVAPPPGVSLEAAKTFAGSRQTSHTVVGGLVQFTLPTRAGRAANWAVTG
jgi:hypothetical protein